MDIKPIKTQADYRAALKEIEPLMAARTNTPEVLFNRCAARGQVSILFA